MEILGAEQVVDGRTFVVLSLGMIELPAWPAVGVAFRVRANHGDGDDVLKSFQMADQVGAVGEGAEEADVQMVPISLGLERAVMSYCSMPGVF